MRSTRIAEICLVFVVASLVISLHGAPIPETCSLGNPKSNIAPTLCNDTLPNGTKAVRGLSRECSYDRLKCAESAKESADASAVASTSMIVVFSVVGIYLELEAVARICY